MLDCQTELGEFFMQEQYRVQGVLEARGYTVINTSGLENNSDVILAKPVDGRLTIVGLAEIKCRKSAGGVPLTREYLSSNGGYLITHQKLKYGGFASSLYRVPFFVIVSLMEENVIMVWQITDSKGNFVEKYEIKKTVTRKTVNGGEIARENAFLPINSKYLTTIE
jgi:hypothetical protein